MINQNLFLLKINKTIIHLFVYSFIFTFYYLNIKIVK